jgi:predicted phosphohydrolase
MSVWAIADLHLSFGVPDKEMHVFGPQWVGYTDKIEAFWKANIRHDDLILIAGDISWAMHPENAKPDLDWIGNLPGTKVMIRGNHDYWWSSLSKVEKVLPKSIHLIQNNAFQWNNISVAGARLWDTKEYGFKECIDFQPNARAKPLTVDDKNVDEAERIFIRELGRLETSLKCLDSSPNKIRMVMTHYPPIGLDLKDSRASKLLEKYAVTYCVFGHLHNVKPGMQLFGEKNGIKYELTSCDYMNFVPIKLL